MSETTKDKIMEVAHELFALRGYEAVSIRDIAAEAEVNTAAINYHFQNKLNLYRSIIQKSMEQLAFDLAKIKGNNEEVSVLEYVEAFYLRLMSDCNGTLACFKFVMALSQSNEDVEIDCLDPYGPPGGEVLAALIQKELAVKSKKDVSWLVRSISAVVFHTAIVACNKNLLKHKEKIGVSPLTLKKDVLRTTQVLLASVK